MGSLDAYKDEIISQLLEGDWKKLFPRKIYSNITSWLKRHKDKESVVIRFTFYNPDKNGKISRESRYAIYLLCNPNIKKGKVSVNDLKFSVEELPLAVPPILYKKPLYCMPSDLLDKILKKKHRSK